MPVRLDLTALEALTKRAERELANIPQAMQKAVEHAAAFERLSHRYISRSGNLERSTRATLQDSSMRLSSVNFEVGRNPNAPYAEYLYKRGYMNVDAATAQAGAELEKYFEEMMRRIVEG